MRYLDVAEYVTFGLDETTGDDVVAAASAMIDAFCRRPSLGLTQFVERTRSRGERRTVFLSNGPMASADGLSSGLVAVRVRYRRCDPLLPMAYVAQAFSLADAWIPLDVSTVDIAASGELRLPWNLLGLQVDEVEVTYTAGYAAVPVPVKVACAQIVRNAQSTPALNLKKQAMDGMRMEYFSTTLLDAEVQRMLQPYVSQRVG